MFTAKHRRRDYSTIVFAVVIAALCFLIVAIAWPAKPVEASDPGLTEPNQGNMSHPDNQNILPGNIPGIDLGSEEVSGSAAAETESKDPATGSNETVSDGGNFAENNNMSGEDASYYLVKEAGGRIYVYFCDSSGSMVQLEETEILYSLLGPEDQKLFDAGIQANSQEELAVLLQDFEG